MNDPVTPVEVEALMDLVGFISILFIAIFSGMMSMMISFIVGKDTPKATENAFFDGIIFGTGVFVGSFIFAISY